MSQSGIVGIVGGAGWLGRAIATQALARGVLSQESLVVSSRSPRNGRFPDWPGIAWTSDNQELARRCDVVVLSVRPEQFRAIPLDLNGRLAISVMAGVSIDTLRDRLNTERIIRCMPNAAAEIGKSYTPWFASPGATDDDRRLVDALMGSCGDVDEVDAENQIDYLSGLSGSGPAFPALLASAMLSHAAEHGLSPRIARRAVQGVVRAASLLDTDEFRPEDAVETFIDYDGTTAAGLKAMVRGGFVGAVHAGLHAAQGASERMAADNRKLKEPD